ncbi:MAG: TolC family protein [Acidobacteria bacterium]|nr:TolC family protein [Acidobacteriota bacterium]
MKRFLYIPTFVFAAAAAAWAQTPSPTPVPTATPVVPVNDAQPVRPENVQGVPQIAPNFQSIDRSLPELGRVGVDMTRQRPLTLRDALEMALENNRDIEVSRKTETIAEFDLAAARGFYQPRLTGQSYYDRSTTPNLSVFSTNQTTTVASLVGNANLTAYNPHEGTVFTGGFTNSRVTSNNPITILSPQFNSGLSFSVLQPLLRGRSFDATRRTIEIAKRNISITDTQFRQRSIETVASVQRAYWDLTYALRNLQVQRDTLHDAKDQLEHNRRLVNEGQLAPIDVVAAETQVANIEQAVYDALNTVNLAENILKNLIAPMRSDGIWTEAIMPVEPVEQDVPGSGIVDSMDAALANRPELELNRIQKDINSLDQRLYRNQTKPQVDLVASYNSSGIGGSLNPNFSNPFARSACAVPTSPECVAIQAQQQAFLSQIGGGATSYSDIFQNKYPTFRVGVNFNIPLGGDKTAKAQLGHAIVEGERIDVQREQIEQGIQVEVRNALQAVHTAEARLRAASIARENSQKQYESEQRKLDNGQSDIYRVLDRQTALTAAKSAELRARTELNKSIADLQRATGTTLKANNIEAKLK